MFSKRNHSGSIPGFHSGPVGFVFPAIQYMIAVVGAVGALGSVGVTSSESGKGSGSMDRDVFIVVDVSGSVPQANNTSERVVLQSMIEEARLLASKLVAGSFFPEDFPDWKWDEALLVSPLREIVAPGNTTHRMSGPGKRAVIVPFGEKSTVHPTPTSEPFQKFPDEYESFVQKNYPTSYKDQNTYITLARARTAELAESLQIKRYYFLMITDAEQDPKAEYTEGESNLLKRWDSKNFVPDKTRIGLFEYTKEGFENRNFQIDVWRVDLDLPPADARIVVSSPVVGRPVAPGSIQVDWSIERAGQGTLLQPQGYNYFVSVVNPETGALLQSFPVKDQHSASISVATPGTYRLTITGSRDAASGEATLPPVLGAAELSLEVADTPPPSQELPFSLALGVPPLVAGRDGLFNWEFESSSPGEVMPEGELTIRALDLRDQTEVAQVKTRAKAWKTQFVRSGDYRLRFEFRPDVPVPGLNYYFFEQTVSVAEPGADDGSPGAPATRETAQEVASAAALQFLLPRNNSETSSKKVIFRWSLAPKTDVPVTQYKLKFSGPEKFEKTSPTSGFAWTFEKPGRYTAQLSVTAPVSLAKSVKPAQVVFTVKGGGGGSIWLVLLLAAAGGGGYYYWKYHSKTKRHR
jgi:hypothetical protein